MGKAREVAEKVASNIKKYFVGYSDLVELMLVALLSGGHLLIEGPTGTGKTTAAKLLALSIGGSFKRVQMTPDLLPSDILGAYYYDVKRGEWVLRKGPIFANVVLIDELNRAPPRTQAAFIEAMQEKQVTIEDKTISLEEPFLVVASQMPFGSEGTYPLTPVLLDRFAYSYASRYPDPDEEMVIMEVADTVERAAVEPVVSAGDVLAARKEVESVYVSDRVKKYIVDLVNYVRKRREVLVGPSPRASIWLYRGSRALAAMEGEDFVVPDHVKKIARNVLRHRIVLKAEYAAEGVKPEDIVEAALKEVEVPKA
ncbi:MAG: AAA family ATPase [Desulfurococcaceae archaeon]